MRRLGSGGRDGRALARRDTSGYIGTGTKLFNVRTSDVSSFAGAGTIWFILLEGCCVWFLLRWFPRLPEMENYLEL